MFRLLRYFAVSSAVALIAVAIGLQALYRHAATAEALDDVEIENVILGRSLSNAIEVAHSDFISVLAAEVYDAGAQAPEFVAIDTQVRRVVAGLPVLMINIWDPNGITVYSSDPHELGAELGNQPDMFYAAIKGNTVSIVTNWAVFEGIGGEVTNRDIVESYLPVRAADGAVQGVFELYSDMTDRLAEIDRTSNRLLTGLLAAFSTLYVGLLLVVRRAERILRQQYVNLEESREAVRAKNRQLEDEIGVRARMERALRQARDQAESASRAKSQFLASMSHELRTPLNAVIGFSEIIADEVLGPVAPVRYRDYAQDIRNSGRHLLALVSEVLDLAEIEAGSVRLEPTAFDVAELVNEAVHAVQPWAVENGNTVLVDCPPSLGNMTCDRAKLQGILASLLDNAVCCTRDGRIAVDAWREGSNGRGHVAFRVRDTGTGMDRRRIDEVFEPLAQHDAFVSRAFEGAGLGLAVSRQMCRVLGGSIEIDSDPGEGATVTVRLPDMADAAAIQHSARADDAVTADAGRRRKTTG